MSSDLGFNVRKIWLRTSAVILVALMTTGAAHSAPSCTDLRSLLAKAQKTSSSPKSVKRYSQAIKQQTKMIAKVTGDLKRYNCNAKANTSACKKLANAYHKMKANLAALQKKRSSMAQNYSGLSVAQIRYKLDQKNCNNKPSFIKVKKNVQTKPLANGIRIASAVPTKKKRKSKLAPVQIKMTGSRSKIVALPSNRNNYGSYRTMCVRTCDGFYFPISSYANSRSFVRDEYACQLMCPGTDAQLYYHNARHQESEDMISYRSGESYASQSFAFSYRTRKRTDKNTCSCNIAAFHAEMTRREALLNKETASLSNGVLETPDIAIPSPSQDPAEDPETLSNLTGNLDNEAVKGLVGPTQAIAVKERGKRNVRQVGPVFIPDTESKTFSK